MTIRTLDEEQKKESKPANYRQGSRDKPWSWLSLGNGPVKAAAFTGEVKFPSESASEITNGFANEDPAR